MRRKQLVLRVRHRYAKHMHQDQIASEVQFQAVRSRGPGGQNVNKVSSAAFMVWEYRNSLGLSPEEKGLVRRKLENHINKEEQFYLRADEYRDLERNKARCLEKLFDFLKAAFHKDKPRKKTKPTYSSKVKKRESKTKRGEVKKNRGKVSWD
jgi:ribosome-associated protein